MLDFYRFSQFEKYTDIFHLISTKVNALPYSFSLALHTNENVNSIILNRELLAKELHIKEHLHFIVANQTHSDNIQVITENKTKGWHCLDDAVKTCDALITNLPNVALTILTADCVPILLYDRKNNVIAAIHAGWKGTKAQIVTKTIKKMQEVFSSDVEHIIAGIAPSIRLCCYEVKKDVAQHFFDFPQSYTQIKNKYMLDLATINKTQLVQSGLHEAHIQMSNICTACEVERFFSYRKEKGCSGRFMSMIGLRDTHCQ